MRCLDLPEMGAAEPWWLDLELFGFEDDDSDEDEDDVDVEDDEEDEDSDDDEDDEDSDEEEEDEDDEDEKSKKPKSKKKNTAGLVKALRQERMGRKRAERELRRLKAKKRDQQGQGSDKSKSKNKDNGQSDDDNEDQDTQDKGPSERERRLAAGLLTTAIDREILAVAQRLRFTDPEDAVKLVSRRDIVSDQDEDDPTEIEIDQESVEDAVKELARKKKHLINRGTSSGGRTGSRVGSRRKSGEPNDDALRKKYNLGASRR